MNPLLAILIAILVLQIVAFAVAVIARYWVLRSETFELHGITVERATDLVAFYLQGIHDHRFGFPTGVFAVDPDRTSPGRIFAREINLEGSAGIAPIKFGLTLPLIGAAAGAAMGADADDAGAGCLVSMLGGMMGFALGAAAACVLVIPFAFLTVVEMILRVLMRGEISATIDRIPDEEDSVRVRFEMRGLSAFGIEHQLRRGMEPPRPAAAPIPPPDPAVAGQPQRPVDRLNAIYLSAASVALIFSIVAIVLIGNAQTSTSSAASYSYAQESEPYEEYEEPYEEEPYEYEEEGEYEEPYEEYEEEEPYEEEGEVEAVPTRYGGAKAMFRRYWTEIDNGEYAAAYNVYYRTFAIQEGVSRSEFVDSEYEYLPEVGTDTMLIEPSSRRPTSPNELWLYVEVPVRDDTGEFEGQCRVFYGDVRMFQADGRWYYRPGVAFGRKPSFGQEGGGIRVLPNNSERCS